MRPFALALLHNFLAFLYPGQCDTPSDRGYNFEWGLIADVPAGAIFSSECAFEPVMHLWRRKLRVDS